MLPAAHPACWTHAGSAVALPSLWTLRSALCSRHAKIHPDFICMMGMPVSWQASGMQNAERCVAVSFHSCIFWTESQPTGGLPAKVKGLLVSQAVCCASGVLDGSGFCCASGALDECGVCDGDASSCALHAVVNVQVQALAGLDEWPGY